MSAADVTPAFVAELRKTHEGKQSKLREHHPRGSWAWLALDILDLCDAIESAWAERDAYLDEVRMTNENEARIMADLIATREECDRLRSELARLRSAPVAVEVPETEIAALAEEFGVWPDDVRKIASKLQPIPTPRILNNGEIHGTPEALAKICEDAGWLWMHSPIGDKKTLLEFMTDALRSKEGEA